MRVFKTKEFARQAHKAGVSDLNLCEATERAEKGLIDAPIGKFLVKQRVARRNEGRSKGFRVIQFYQVGARTVFLHMFAKNDQSNLTATEEATYREIAKALAEIKAEQVQALGSGLTT